eukprot:7024562-Pyramimonas_sp.AAC.1
MGRPKAPITFKYLQVRTKLRTFVRIPLFGLSVLGSIDTSDECIEVAPAYEPGGAGSLTSRLPSQTEEGNPGRGGLQGTGPLAGQLGGPASRGLR